MKKTAHWQPKNVNGGGGCWGYWLQSIGGFLSPFSLESFLLLSRFSYCLASKPYCIACCGNSVSWAFPPSYWFLLSPLSQSPPPHPHSCPHYSHLTTCCSSSILARLIPPEQIKKEKLHEREFFFSFQFFFFFFFNLNSNGWDSRTTSYWNASQVYTVDMVVFLTYLRVLINVLRRPLTSALS